MPTPIAQASATIPYLIEQQTHQTPTAIAIEHDGETMTYADLNRRANQLADYLRQIGVRADSLVGVCLERSPDMIVALLAILKAGGAYVPIDPSYPPARIYQVVDDTHLSLLITHTLFRSLFPGSTVNPICLDACQTTLRQCSPENGTTAIAPEDLAYVIFTSGSTGKPKGVMIEHGSMQNFVTTSGKNYAITPADRVLQFASLSFDVAVEEIFVTLIRGATLVLRTESMLRSIPAFLETCQRWSISILNIPTAFWHQICAELPHCQIPSCLRLVIIGSERAVPRWLERWQQHVSPAIRLINAYGPTEATVGSTTCDLAGPHAVETQGSRTLPIGKPIDNVATYVLDETLNQVAPTETGELYLAGAGLARGYLNRPALTQQHFIQWQPTPQAPAVRLYKTGDLVRCREDGHLEFLDRVDNQVKIRGFRIELNEIEAVLEKEPRVQQAIVLARDSSVGHKQLVAYIVQADGDTARSDTAKSDTAKSDTATLILELRRWLRNRLPSYMVPSAFVPMTQLPLSPNGKVDRRALPEPNTERPMLDTRFVAPRTVLEQDLAQLWSDILGIDTIGLHDSFLDLGGDSLQTAQLLAKIEQRYSIDVALHDFFHHPTIAGLVLLLHLPHTQAPRPRASNTMSLEQLWNHVVLDATIQPGEALPPSPQDPAVIFITGATGFIGAGMVATLLRRTDARLYCLVRSLSPVQALQRLQAALAPHTHDTPIDPARLVPVLGDLSKPRLGLSAPEFQRLAHTVDRVYHCGANVNMLYPYPLLKDVNVQGTHEVLRLASQDRCKPLFYLSTIDVFEGAAQAGLTVCRETDDISNGTGISGGYAQSKWVAEQLVQQAGKRGLPVHIYRPGVVSGHSDNGHSNTTDALCRLIKSLIQLQQAPDLDVFIDMTPVDYISQAIVELSLMAVEPSVPFHLVNPNPLPLATLVQGLVTKGYPIQTVSYQQWQHTIVTQPNALSALATVQAEADRNDARNWVERWVGGGPGFDCSHTQTRLAHVPWTRSQCWTPNNTPHLVHVYLNAFIRSGFIAPPMPPPASTSRLGEFIE